jgi:integrase
VFLRYLHREARISRNLSGCVEGPKQYRLSKIPRSITRDEVRRVFATIDRRTAIGKRDYAMLLLLVTYGLRAREIAALTLEDIDWRRDRLRIPWRKAGHSSVYPLSTAVGAALLGYLQRARPAVPDRNVFLTMVAPWRALRYTAISLRAGRYLQKAGVPIPRPGSHTFRHTCVQRLVDADFSLKAIGDYVGHRSPQSTEIYSKVAIEPLRAIAVGSEEEVL